MCSSALSRFKIHNGFGHQGQCELIIDGRLQTSKARKLPLDGFAPATLGGCSERATENLFVGSYLRGFTLVSC
jgi:hypothetical protein